MEDTGWLSQLKRGLLELCILNLLSHEHMYGYKLVKRLTAIPGLIVTEGTIYPLISRLKRGGLIITSFEESPYGPVRKIYKLSKKGDKKRQEINKMWQTISKAIDTLIVFRKK